MALLLREADVQALLTMPLALEAVEEAFRRQAAGEAIVHPRRRLELPEKAFLHYMAAADTGSGYLGMKLYTSVRGVLRFLVPLYLASTGELVALIEAGYLGQMRTGAASGVATKFMSRANAQTLGIVGTGLQALTQLEALAAVRKITSIRAFGRDRERRKRFCEEIEAKLGIPVRPAGSAEEAVRGLDIVVSATTASQPVVLGAWLAPGTHVNAIGANFPQKRELDDEAVGRAAIIAVDLIEQSKMEAGDLIQAFRADPGRWTTVRELAEIVAGKTPGRTDAQQVTLFKSNGIAIWDVALAVRVFELARERKVGWQVPLWEAGGS
ncbi:MAG TPA: ornithine cyclodeaminase family protein [Candidatus Acidoferrales bacterium]|nr:ornithine cyclodeaminase family protein [Candidatus Acidoferrales bacterium]